jgi:hypothetical protein
VVVFAVLALAGHD